MSAIELVAQMDALEWGMLIGSLAFLGMLVWFLVGDEQFDEEEEWVVVMGDRAPAARRERGREAVEGQSHHGDGAPKRPPRPRRAA